MQEKTIGLISDTHGLMRPKALEALKYSELILHAGDVGNLEILQELETIAPVHAVYGNCDGPDLKKILPAEKTVQVEQLKIHLIHDIKKISSEESTIIVYGHSHKAAQEQKNGLLFLNPGSAGPRRFHLPVSVAILKIQGPHAEAEFITW